MPESEPAGVAVHHAPQQGAALPAGMPQAVPQAGPPDPTDHRQPPAGRRGPRPSPSTGTAPSPRRSQDDADPSEVWGLVEQAKTGDREAFAKLYDRYVNVVFRYIYFRLGDRNQAEDFTSETFLRALRRIHTVTYQGRDVGAWLVTIARNIVLDHVKSSRYRLEMTTANMLDADQAQEGPEGSVLEHLTSKELLRCVTQLNAEQQECIVLRFLQGLSVSETAQIMGKKDGAIKALQHRAVRRLAALVPEGIR